MTTVGQPPVTGLGEPDAADIGDLGDIATWQHVNHSTVSDAFLARTRRALARQRSICRTPERPSTAVLRDVLAQSEGTYFGKKHHLTAVRTMADWKRAVPVHSYSELRPYIDELLDGHGTVLTSSEPYALLRTSGSSGQPKLIPTTRHWRNRYRGRALYAQWGLYFEAIGIERSRGAAVLDLSWERSSSSRSVGTYPSYGISQRPAAVSNADWLPPWYNESWFRGVDGEGYRAGLYRRLRLLAGADVRLVVALNASKIVGLAEVLAERADDLIADLRNGTLDGRPCHGGRDRDLASRLAGARRANGGLRLADLWPGLDLVVTWNSASAALYRPWLEEATPGIRKLPFSATGTEGIVTIPVDGHDSAGPLAVDLGLYEFVPADDPDAELPTEPHVETLDYREVEVGRTYRLVMTQANGLYRYDLQDRYTVVDRVGGVPRLEFAGRSGFGSSFTGEKLTEEDVYLATRKALGTRWGGRPLFSCVPVWATPPGYTLVIEWPEERMPPVHEFAEDVEAALQELNIEYADKRRAGRLTPLAVRRVPPGTFWRIEEQRRREGGSPAQLKHHWIQRDSALLTYLRAALADSTSVE
jgi:hypothetical protein